MDANTITAISATVVATAALAVSIAEARSARKHQRNSMRPLLQLYRTRDFGRPAGIVLYNQGLGPAIITNTTLVLDGEVMGSWDLPNYRKIQDELAVWTRVTTFNTNDSIPPNGEVELLVLPDYDRQRHSSFWDLVWDRMHLEIDYQSLHGESFIVKLVPQRLP